MPYRNAQDAARERYAVRARELAAVRKQQKEINARADVLLREVRLLAAAISEAKERSRGRSWLALVLWSLGLCAAICAVAGFLIGPRVLKMRGGDPFADFEGRDLRTAIRLEMTLRAEGKSVGNYALWPALDRAAEDTLNAAPYMLEDQLYGLGLIPHVELEVRWLDSERVVVVWKKPARAGGHNGRVSLFQRSRGWWRWVARKDAALGNGEMTVRWSDYDTRLAIVENSRDGECATTTLVVDGGSLRELPGPVCSMECPMPEEAAEPAAL